MHSISIDMIENGTEKAYFAGGCFWGVEYWLRRFDSVLSVQSGYMGGTLENPSYGEVSTGTTGHAETVEVVFYPKRLSYRDLAKRFFEIHDPTVLNRQGPDTGEQYRSVIFYTTKEQKHTIEELIGILRDRGYKVVTKVVPAGNFYPAEDYHQDYYEKSGGTPYCHTPVRRFSEE